MMENEAGKHPRAPPPFPPPNCPRCYSGNTKFCYYNNYSMSQPRYICKECRRYWTHGGVLRNIPTGGTNRKRARPDSASSSSQISKPPPTANWSDGPRTFRPQITQSFNCYQPPFMFNPNYEVGDVNTAFGAVNVAVGGGATPPTQMSPQLSPLNGVGEFGTPFVQRHPHPPAWAGQNMGLTSTSANTFLAAAANVVSIEEWSELKDMDNEGDPLQSYKPPSP